MVLRAYSVAVDVNISDLEQELSDEDPIQRGVEEGWIRPPLTVGRIGLGGRVKGLASSSTVLLDDRCD